jgi:DNA-binding transcriptional LysR family regulator
MRPDHVLAKAGTIEWKQVLEWPTALLQGAGPLGNYIDQKLFEAGLQLVPDYRVEQIHTAVGVVSAGLALGVMSNITASALEHEGLVARELVNPSIVRPLSLAHLAERELSPAAEKLRESVMRHWHAGTVTASDARAGTRS